ncbi:MAG: DNA topoisomerase IV subunit A [Chlamydiia bacterium]|nr:DNA topoisomerase IV subunit A [Chlamydiia bacterium]
MGDRKESVGDLKEMMAVNFLEYASYVILDRAIPHIADGLKPVQRRILYILFKIHDGRLHKVMNVAGQVMALHPHGDAPIVDALVNLANKEYLLDRQGNFGNPMTGDPSAAARYIETRLSPLAREALFNPDITELVPSYDGRNNEPVTLPSKIPLLLMQGAEGIAVGMSTRIFPHNFCELLKAEIAILEGKEFSLIPDFRTGGLIDASEYDCGRGRVKLRARIEIADTKTVVIKEICYGTTTESLIHSIEDAAKKGKIKIDSIDDFTTEKIHIEVHLPRGCYAEELIEQLYAFTDCEISLSSQIVVIKDQAPIETTVNVVLRDHVERLKGYLRMELEIERRRLQEKIFEKTLERLFIENRLYKLIEEIRDYARIHEVIQTSLEPFFPQLLRIPTVDDRERLLSIPIRKISRYDLEKNLEEMEALRGSLREVEQNLVEFIPFVIAYIQRLLDTYGKDYPRRTKVREIELIDKKSVARKNVRVFFKLDEGYVGTKVTGGDKLDCTDFDKLLLLFDNGSFKVIPVPEKQFVPLGKEQLIYVGIAGEEKTFSCVYSELKTNVFFAKRFEIKRFQLDRLYRYTPEGCRVDFLSTESEISGQLHLIPRPRVRINKIAFHFDDILVKGVQAIGKRLSPYEGKRVKCVPASPKAEGENGGE